MSPWSIPQQVQQMPVRSGKRNNLLFSMVLSFALAVMGIPVYLMIILKVIGMMN